MSIAFHRLAHSARLNPAKPARWWHPLTELAVFAVAGLALAALWSGAAYWLADTFGVDRAFIDSSDESHPLGLTDLLMYVIIMIPAALIAARLGGRRAAGFLWSAAGRIRWRLLWRSLPPVLAIYAAYAVLSAVIDGASGFRLDQHALIMLGVIVALVPIQAAAEELVFRAWLPQLVGTWVRSPWLPYLVSLPIFMVGHEYGIKGQIDVAVFAICAAVLTHYTRGIEAAIALHAVGNVAAFGLETVGVYESATSDATFTWPAIILSVAVTVLSTAVLLRVTRAERAAAKQPATAPAGWQPRGPRASAAMDALPR